MELLGNASVNVNRGIILPPFLSNAHGLRTPPRRPRPLQPPPTSCTTSLPTTSPARIKARRDCGWCHGALRTLRRVDMSAPVTICRHHLPVGFWRVPSQRSWPAAQAVMPRTVGGGHRVGVSIGTEHELCPSSLSALQQVALPIMPYGYSRDLVPQACAMRSRPSAAHSP